MAKPTLTHYRQRARELLEKSTFSYYRQNQPEPFHHEVWGDHVLEGIETVAFCRTASEAEFITDMRAFIAELAGVDESDEALELGGN